MKPPTRIVVPAMSLARAILIGQLVVNLPVLLIILGAAGIGMALAYRLALVVLRGSAPETLGPPAGRSCRSAPEMGRNHGACLAQGLTF